MTDYPLTLDAFSRWYRGGERGVSSESIVSHLTGGFRRHPNESPLDGDDLRRCLLLLEAVPEAKAHFHLMADVSPEWAVIVENLDRFRDLLDAESPDWRCGIRLVDWGGPYNQAVRAAIDNARKGQ